MPAFAHGGTSRLSSWFRFCHPQNELAGAYEVEAFTFCPRTRAPNFMLGPVFLAATLLKHGND
jgi:hypothetical protein